MKTLQHVILIVLGRLVLAIPALAAEISRRILETADIRTYSLLYDNGHLVQGGPSWHCVAGIRPLRPEVRLAKDKGDDSALYGSGT